MLEPGSCFLWEISRVLLRVHSPHCLVDVWTPALLAVVRCPLWARGQGAPRLVTLLPLSVLSWAACPGSFACSDSQQKGGRILWFWLCLGSHGDVWYPGCLPWGEPCHERFALASLTQGSLHVVLQITHRCTLAKNHRPRGCTTVRATIATHSHVTLG